MNNLRKEFIKEILETLKIPLGAFNVGTIADEIKHIQDTDLRAFHKALFGTSHSYLNGMDRIIKVAERFKPIVVDNAETKAKELISLCETLNTKIGKDAVRMGTDFIKLVETVKLPTVSDEDISFLNNVKPYMDHKQLIINIRNFQTSVDAVKAFKQAVVFHNEQSLVIENSTFRKMIRG